MKIGSLVNKNAVYEKFKNYFTNDYKGTEEASLKELRRYAEYYFWFRLCKSGDEKLDFLLRQFHEVKSTVAFGVMLWLFDKCFDEDKMTKQQLYETLNTLLCFQYRRSVCRYSTNALNKIYTVLPKEISETDDIPKKLLDVLTKKTRTQTFPRNDEFRAAFINSDLYSTKLAKYTLAMLENKSNPREKVSLTEQITIEHIMPQTLSPTWKAELGKSSEQVHVQWLHTIGNLTLSGSNSELGNRPFSEKKNIFSKSNFTLSREVALATTWNEQVIKDRANKLADIALNIWALPDEYNKARGKIEIDYSATYNIMDDINIIGESPRSYIVLDEENNIDSWKSLFLGVLKYLYEYDPAEFENLLKNETFKSRHLAEPANSDYQYRSKSPDEICPGYYAETSHSAQDLVTFTQIAAEIFGFQDEVFFTLKRKGNASNNKTVLSETKALQLQFWQAFIEYARNDASFSSMFSFQKPSGQHWYTFAVGSSEYHLNLTVNSREKRVGVDIYINDNKDLFRKLKYQQKQLEAFLSMSVKCVEATKACRIYTFFSADIRDKDSWSIIFEWFTETAIKFKELATKYA